MRPQGIGLAFHLLLCGLIFIPACKRAERYGGIPKPAAKSAPTEEQPTPPEPSHHVWLEPKELWDFPILFVPSTTPEWSQLADYWNALPRPAAALPVASLSIPPLLLPAV